MFCEESHTVSDEWNPFRTAAASCFPQAGVDRLPEKESTFAAVLDADRVFVAMAALEIGKKVTVLQQDYIQMDEGRKKQ